MKNKGKGRWQWALMVLRLFAAIPGGYFLTAALVTLLGGVLPFLGMARSEAVVLSAMSGFILYLLWLLWAFSVRSVFRLCASLIAGTALATGLSTLLH